MNVFTTVLTILTGAMIRRGGGAGSFFFSSNHPAPGVAGRVCVGGVFTGDARICSTTDTRLVGDGGEDSADLSNDDLIFTILVAGGFLVGVDLA